MAQTNSQQPRMSNTQEAVQFVLSLWENNSDMPEWGAAGRAAKLREFARTEPILSGAMSSMTSKALSLDWQVTGGRNRVQQYQTLLNEAEDGAGWQKMLAKWVQDYLNTDQGGFLELARLGRLGPVQDIYHIDGECIGLTGNVLYPIVYVPKLTSGKLNKAGGIRFAPTDYAQIVDMPSADETKFGLGFCSVSRAYKAAKVLLALYNYDEQKLADMPMPGLVTVTGLTMDELKDAFGLYEAHRQSRQQSVFKGLLWLAAVASPLQQIAAELVSFASLPENFDREQTVSLYIYTLALDFGVDAREFWPATQSGATKGEAEVQAQKAKGKGFGQMISSIERAIVWHILPRGIEFNFDRRNDDDDLAREILRNQQIKNVRTLWEPASSGGFGTNPLAAKPGEEAAPQPPANAPEGLISTAEARRLLVEMGALPQWIAPTEDLTLHSLDKRVDEIFSQKAAGAMLERNEDYVAINRAGEVVTLWTTRSVHQIIQPPYLKERKQAALAHLQAAGLLITDGSHAD